MNILRYQFAWLLIVMLIGGTSSAKGLPCARNHSFQLVTTCKRDYATVNFCDRYHMSAIRKAIAKRAIDFDNQFILLIIPEEKLRKIVNVAVIDSLTGIVYPLPFDAFGGYVDSHGRDIAAPKREIVYSLNNNKICFSGSIYDYRNTWTSTVTCYIFDKNIFKMCLDDGGCKQSAKQI